MARRNPTLTISICTSVTIHVAALYAMAWWYLRHPPSLRLAALSAPQRLAPIIIRTPPPKPPPPPPKDFSEATEKPLRDDSGEHEGKEIANRSTPGEHPMEAPRGLDQANLSKSSKTDEMDSKLNDQATPAQNGSPVIASGAPQPKAEFGVAQAVAAPPAPKVKEVKGHSTRASDTDSFALVSKSNNVRFHDGQMEARQGRKVKTTRPDYGLSAMVDSQSLTDITVILGVLVDATGNVTDVTILRSSGSQNIDEPTKRAVYSWWFEPKTDKDGRPMPDKWVVRID